MTWQAWQAWQAGMLTARLHSRSRKGKARLDLVLLHADATSCSLHASLTGGWPAGPDPRSLHPLQRF